MKVGHWGLLLALGTSAIQAQQFEVASVKLSGPKSIRGSDGGPGSKDPTRYTFGLADLKILIMIAYDVENFQLFSKFDLDREELDLSATLPPGTTKEQFRAMLRNLLEERFHLKVHTESREFAALALEVTKSGPKFGESTGKSKPIPRAWLEQGFPDLAPDRPAFTYVNARAAGGSILVRARGQQQTMERMASTLRTSAFQPIVDRTGLTGKYDFTLEFANDSAAVIQDEAADAPPAPSLNAALQQQLGLQLTKKKLPFKVVVVDAVDRFPTEN